MGLKQFEERLERLVEGTLSRPFRTTLQPVEIGRRLTREMDLQRKVGVKGMIAPNAFSISLSTQDVDRLSGHLDALIHELVVAAKEHALEEQYAFVGPVEVEVFRSARLKAGRLAVVAEVREGDLPAELILSDGSRRALGESPCIIGRMPECGVVLSDPNVSRHHAQVQREADHYVVSDLGSTNGTKVNGIPMRSQTLNAGDEIMVGSTRIRFESA
ncbi:MAG: DUF3662 and FHA domain-containing protein [Actinobacteria bacterium]|nr:DUF3662 and FHA domain-containing protein [Actinomycetota bacterium]